MPHDRSWMYSGRRKRGEYTDEWMQKTTEFVIIFGYSLCIWSLTININVQQYFKWASGTEVEAKRVVRNVIKNLIPQAIYEARIWSITSYHRKILKVSISRSEACRKYHTLEQYMRRKPWWFQKVPEAWRKQAEKWCSEDWKSRSRTGRACKQMMECGAHCQGSASLARYRRILEKREQRPVSEIEAYAMGRMDEQQRTYCNQRTADRIILFTGSIL